MLFSFSIRTNENLLSKVSLVVEFWMLMQGRYNVLKTEGAMQKLGGKDPKKFQFLMVLGHFSGKIG